MTSKPNILVLGGVGFIGRNLVTYLVENKLAGRIRVADKAMPATSYFSARSNRAFEEVDFIQANLGNGETVKKIFSADQPWDIVVSHYELFS